MKLKRVLLMLAVSGALMFITLPPARGGGGGGGGGGGTRVSSYGSSSYDVEYENEPIALFTIESACSVLGLRQNCIENGIDEVKRAFRKLSVQAHPDKEGGSKERLQELASARDFLVGEEKTMKSVHHNRAPPTQKKEKS